jgi:hypothetical protein
MGASIVIAELQNCRIAERLELRTSFLQFCNPAILQFCNLLYSPINGGTLPPFRSRSLTDDLLFRD